MGGIGERLLQLIEIEGLDNSSFGEIIGVKPGTVGEMITEVRPFGGKYLKILAIKKPNINLNWFLTGNGDMYLHKNVSDEIKSENNIVKTELSLDSDINIDPVKLMFLQYMKDPDVQNMIRQILK